MLYVPPIGGAANDPYVDGNPGAGTEGSAVPAAAIENPQREIVAVITGAGLAPNAGDLTQLRQAILKMIQSGQRAVIVDNAPFAGAVVGTGKAVYWDSANNRFDLAAADGSVKQSAVGFADVPNGKVYCFGSAALFAGLAPGARYYLDTATAGAITSVMPAANAVFLGVAKNATEVFVDIDAPVGSSGALPLAALPFPTIGTSSNTISLTGNVVAGQGGSVSVPAGIWISIAQEVIAGATGVLSGFTTQAWTSGNLAPGSTYYLRAQVQNGALVFYVQLGSDTDPIPVSQKGTPGGAAGGGFDSTVIDMLVAKVVTGAAGSVPTVTALANKAVFSFSALYQTTCTADASGGFSLVYNPTLNWARTPKVTASVGYDITAITTTSALDRCYISSQVVNRYSLNITGYFDIFLSVGGNVIGNINVLGVA